MKMRSVLLFTVLPLTWFGTAVQAEVVVESPWVREAPPTAETLAAYMVLRNNGDTAQVLQGVTTPSFERVEIHQTTMHDDMASMETQATLSIPAQGKVALTPGSYHLMLMGKHQPLKEGDTVDFSLQFQDGKTMEVHAPVRKDASAPEGEDEFCDHKHHHDHEHEHEHHHKHQQ